MSLTPSDTDVLPGQMRYIISPLSSGSTPRSPPSWTCLENLQREASGPHPNQIPEPLPVASFNAKKQWLYSEFSLDNWAAIYPISEETHFSHLLVLSRSFLSLPRAQVRVGNVDLSVNWELWLQAYLPTHHSSLAWRLSGYRRGSDLSIHLMRPFSITKTRPRDTQTVLLGAATLPQPWKSIPPFSGQSPGEFIYIYDYRKWVFPLFTCKEINTFLCSFWSFEQIPCSVCALNSGH